ncbi:MAG: prolyl oligopeptidase family serine peptidase [Planctomycetaceae bacterium]|jgi:predicted alpha/beta superfamily hydrolase|nr:prolyl oligopeptidase family serine peptidase [Planctomycetaceae bacterium]
MLRKLFCGISFCACIVWLLFASAVFAQPDLNRKHKVSVVETGSDLYRFETFTVDAHHHYRITVAVPKKTPPEHGFAALYLLDGNAVLDDWNEDLFANCGGNLPVLVCIGYETDLRFDVKARALDDTPVQRTGQAPPVDFQGRTGGGADKFAEIIETKIKPKVESIVKTDKQRQGIWGHSYGGLFVLNTLFRHTEMFRYYYAADPSLWYGEGLILHHKETFLETFPHDAQNLQKALKKEVRLTLMTGSGSLPNHQTANRQTAAQPTSNHQKEKMAVPSDAAETMVKQLKPKLTDAVFLHYDLTHGAMFGHALKESIRLFSRL